MPSLYILKSRGVGNAALTFRDSPAIISKLRPAPSKLNLADPKISGDLLQRVCILLLPELPFYLGKETDRV